MSRYVLRRVLLFNSIFLFILIGSAYGWGDGPCVDLNNDCGNYGGGMGSCKFDINLGYCTGGCQSYCPSGPADEYCLGEIGDCSSYGAVCSKSVTYSCETGAHDPPHCLCEEFGY